MKMSYLFKWLGSWWDRLKNLFQWFVGSDPENKWWPWKWRFFKALFQIKTWLFLRPRILKILLSVKTWLVLGLGASNFFVLSFVLNTYLQSDGITLYSTVASESLVKRECKEQVEKVIKWKEGSQVCRVTVTKRHKGARYKQNMKFKIKKEGEKLVITIDETHLSDRTKHAEKLEAAFCEEGCEREDLSPNASAMDVMKGIVAIAEKQEEKIKDQLNDAREEYERARINERTAKVKHRRCEGYWNEEDQVYEEYDTEERLDCKMAKLVRMNHIQKDQYYQDILKDEFWKVALSDEEDPYLLLDHLRRIRSSPYHFSPASRHSAGLIGNYVSWRERYEELEDDHHREFVINQIVRNASDLSHHLGQKGQKDFVYLRSGLDKHFDMAGARLNSVRTPLSPTIHAPVSGSSSPHHPVNQEVLNLY